MKAFVDGLREFRSDFEAVTRLADPEDEMGRRLGRLRNGFFHYPSLRRKTAQRGKLPVMSVMRDSANTEGTIELGGEALGGVRAHFADDLVAKLAMTGLDEDRLRGLLEELAQLQAAYNRFAQAALARYLNGLPEGVVTQVRGE